MRAYLSLSRHQFIKGVKNGNVALPLHRQRQSLCYLLALQDRRSLTNVCRRHIHIYLSLCLRLGRFYLSYQKIHFFI